MRHPLNDLPDLPRRGPGRRHGELHDPFLGPMGPGGFGPMGPGGRGRRGPGRRGDVRNAILALLEEGPRNGYQAIADIADRTDGLWRPSAGSVYPALGLLEDEGLIDVTEVDGKKAYVLTEAGRAYVADHKDELTEPWKDVAKPREGFLDIRQELGQLSLALAQVVRAGDADQVAKARGVLDEARKSLYRILADG